MKLTSTIIFLAASISAPTVSSFVAFPQASASTHSGPTSTAMKAVREVAPTSNYLDSLSTSVVVDTAETPSERRLHLLDDALRFNSSAASELLSELNQLRTSGASQVIVEESVNGLLLAVDGPLVDETTKSPLPFWTRILPLTRFSRRARRASLRRVLDMSTPTVDEKESLGDDAEADRRRRRRSLVVLLRALANAENDDQEEGDSVTGVKVAKKGRTPAIVLLEKAARQDAKSSVKTEDMKSRMPPGLETPEYSVLVQRKGYEVRRYEPYSLCSVAMNKPRPVDAAKTDAKISNPQLAGASAFGALAGYLFGKNQQSTSMKMTTPVLSAGEGDERTMSFVLPSDFWKDDGLKIAPQPMEGSGVQLEKDEGGDRAVVMFGGFAAKKDVDSRKAQLLDSLAKDSDWKAEEGATVTLAQYNDPFTPPWRRRNEIAISVVPR